MKVLLENLERIHEDRIGPLESKLARSLFEGCLRWSFELNIGWSQRPGV